MKWDIGAPTGIAFLTPAAAEIGDFPAAANRLSRALKRGKDVTAGSAAGYDEPQASPPSPARR